MLSSSEVWVYSDALALAKELMGKGKELAEGLRGGLGCLCVGPDGLTDEWAQLMAYGADKAYLVVHPLLKEPDAEVYADALSQLIDKYKPGVLLVGSTKLGLELSPRLAERLNASYCTDALKIELDEEGKGLLVDRLTQGGNMVESLRLTGRPIIVTVPRGAFTPPEPSEGVGGEVIKFKPELKEPKVKLIEKRPKLAAGVKLTDAQVIVAFGRGLKKKEDIRMIQELADALRGVVGCSRPIAEDLRWLPKEHYIGLSGQKVSPRLYIACGISGQIQHLVGIRNAKTIVAINIDKDAPIFENADYGIVGDLYKLVPALTEAVKRLAKA